MATAGRRGRRGGGGVGSGVGSAAVLERGWGSEALAPPLSVRSGLREFLTGVSKRGAEGRQMASACDGRHIMDPPSVEKNQVRVRRGT